MSKTTATPPNLAELESRLDIATQALHSTVSIGDQHLIRSYHEARALAGNAVDQIRGTLGHHAANTESLRHLDDLPLRAHAVAGILEADAAFMATLKRAEPLLREVRDAEEAIDAFRLAEASARAKLAEARRVALEKATAEIDGLPEVAEAEKHLGTFRRLGQKLDIGRELQADMH